MPGPRVAPKTGFAFFEAIGRPRLIAAPMVNQSELPFRLLMKKYGAQLCYTPMIDSKSFANSAAYRASSFSTCKADRPLVAQFAGDDPATVLKAALLVQHECAPHLPACIVCAGPQPRGRSCLIWVGIDGKRYSSDY